MTRGPLLGREKLWRAGIGGKARRRSQACGAGARQPGEPQGRMRDATSPRTCWWRKPSRPGGTARAEHVRRREASDRSGRKSVGVDSSRHADGGVVFEKTLGKAFGFEPGGSEKRLRQRIRQHAAGGVGFMSTARAGRHDDPKRSEQRADPAAPSPGKSKRPGTLHGEEVPSLDLTLDRIWRHEARRHA